jgi:hypothetical protein
MTPLHWLGQEVQQLAVSVPLPVVRAMFIAVPMVLLVWVLRLPREQTAAADGTGRLDENLKLWASLALIVQIIIYSMLG